MPVLDSDSLVDELFAEFEVEGYLAQTGLDKLLGVELATYGDPGAKRQVPMYRAVDPENTTPLAVHLDDLLRLHFLVSSRRALTVLEFGSGKSTTVIADALLRNKVKYEAFVEKNIRRKHAFELHSVEDDGKWIAETKRSIPEALSAVVHLHECGVHISEFCGRMCSYYNNIPNVLPDLIYLDGPSQFAPKGSLRGLTTADVDRVPMAADILAFEHFLAPGTLVIVDGRTANARFLKCNLQRDWAYQFSPEMDQHFFEMREPPLGKYNQAHLDFVRNGPFDG